MPMTIIERDENGDLKREVKKVGDKTRLEILEEENSALTEQVGDLTEQLAITNQTVDFILGL